MMDNRKNALSRIQTFCMETFGLSPGLSLLASLLAGLVVVAAVFWFIHSAPPHVITITSGPPGSGFDKIALQYQAILKQKGVTLKILQSHGSEENLQRLQNHAGGVDIGFVQGGVTNADSNQIVSLGSLGYQPMMIFYRGAAPLQLLSQLKGKRLVIGPPGSGDRSLALAILQLNGISNNASATFADLDAAAAAKALGEGAVDAIFLSGDSASGDVMRNLLRSPGIHLFDVTQADGYVRRITYLNKLDLPKGSIDFGKDIPDHDVSLIGPTIELLARSGLHPALSDLLLETARKVHGKARLFQRLNEFPAPLEHDFPLSADALRFYTSGKGFFYRYLPFWMASVVNRILVAFVPMVLLLVPGLRLIPAACRWRIQTLIFHRYRSLLALEREVQTQDAQAHPEIYLSRLDQIESAVNRMKVPASFAGEFYGLRGHIEFVRERILHGGGNAPKHG